MNTCPPTPYLDPAPHWPNLVRRWRAREPRNPASEIRGWCPGHRVGYRHWTVWRGTQKCPTQWGFPLGVPVRAAMHPGKGVMGIPREKPVGSSPLSTRQAECASHYSDGGLCSALLLLCSHWLDRAEGQRLPHLFPHTFRVDVADKSGLGGEWDGGGLGDS